MGYFITEQEIQNKKLDTSTLAATMLFLGVFGVHRFYAGRPLSGCLIILSLVVTSMTSLWIIIPLLITEFYKLGVIMEKNKNNPTTKVRIRSTSYDNESKAEDYSNAPRHTLNSTSKGFDTNFGKVTVEGGLSIYDVSSVEGSTITNTGPTVPKPPIEGEWINKLELPYERQDLQIPQIRKATYLIYEKLALYIDSELKESGGSLDKVIQSSRNQGFLQYGNILYTIFCIAEGEVTTYYSDRTRGYNNRFSYELLGSKITKKQLLDFETYAKDIVTKLPPANKDIIEHYKLTKHGTASTWWDKDGEIRIRSNLTPDHIRTLNLTPPRHTQLFKDTHIRALILLRYMQTLATLDAQRKETSGWTNKMTIYLQKLFDGSSTWISETYDAKILSHILKLSEQSVRLNLPYNIRPLDASKEAASLRRIMPKEAAEAVLETVNKPIDPKLNKESLSFLRQISPSAWRDDLKKTDIDSIDQTIKLLNTYGQEKVISRLSKEILKSSKSDEVKLLAIYQSLLIDGTLDTQLDRQLKKLIHPLHLKSLTNLVSYKYRLSKTLAAKLIALKNPPRKRVKLDQSKLQKASSDHERAIRSVVDYIGEDNEQEDQISAVNSTASIATFEDLSPSTDSSGATNNLSSDQEQFIDLIIKSGNNLSLELANQHTKAQNKMLNGYVKQLNQSLYEIFDDQVISIQGDRIEIDEYYLKPMKELSNATTTT